MKKIALIALPLLAVVAVVLAILNHFAGETD